MKNKKLNVFVAVISHKRPQNISQIKKLIGEECTFFVNDGEKEIYEEAGAENVVECGNEICSARNEAIRRAQELNIPCIQVSDDLRYLRKIYFDDEEDKRKVREASFEEVVNTLVGELKRTGLFYGGIAVTSNRMNYHKGVDFSYDKLIVNDLICIMPDTEYIFDVKMALKEDYDFTLVNILYNKGIVRCNQYYGQFPHRENEGGANTYRTSEAEKRANEKVMGKWGDFLKTHHTRENQISFNYKAIKEFLKENYNLDKITY